jgi:hypothetical protein
VTLHPLLLDEMLTDEMEATHLRLEGRFGSIEKDGSDVYVRLNGTNVGEATVRFAGGGYDAEPFQVAVVTHHGDLAPEGQWPAGLFHSVHPILDRGFVCIRGTFEYHCHPSHLGDAWSAYRQTLRLPQLLGHILKRVGK